MNLKILPSANEDLINGHHFYEQQAQGLGGYFLDSLFLDIDFFDDLSCDASCIIR